MCDTVAGELIVCFHEKDTAAAALIEDILAKQISHVEVVEHLHERIVKAQLTPRKTKYRFYRLRVPPGQENYKINFLQFYYKHHVLNTLAGGGMDPEVMNWSNNHLQVVPNSILALRQSGSVPSVGFSKTATHDDYKKICGFSGGYSPTVPVTPKRVQVLDSGLDPASIIVPSSNVNIVDHSQPTTVDDDLGHGTAVAEVIHDLCPSAEFAICKVADQDGRASEWDTIMALGIDTQSQIINISLAFGLDDISCPVCGRESRATRSAVFENLLKDLHDDPDGPLIVAAAGNGALTELAFPARFDNVIAIESLNKARDLSRFTNRSTYDQTGANHNYVFVLPGGEVDASANATEYIGTSTSGAQFYGTSFAAAYASGLIAEFWSQAQHGSKDRTAILAELRANADTSVPNYATSTHGNGLMVFK
jgi:subtilisin family serine protease